MSIEDVCMKLEALTATVSRIEVGLEKLRCASSTLARPPAALPSILSPKPRPRYFPSDWPKIGGRDELPDFGDLFVSSAYRDQYHEGQNREIYAAASEGLARLASRLKMPLYKVSSCGPGRLTARMRELGRDRYAAEWFRDGEYVVEQDGFDKWFPSHLFVTKPPAPNSPIKIGPRALSVALPRTMSAEAFDVAFDAEIRKGAIDLWVMSEEGARHCTFLRVDPAMCQRSTVYAYGSAARPCPAKEVVVFRIREDADRLLNIAERVILRHFGLIP